MSNTRKIIISNRLPVRIEKKNDTLEFIPSEGGLATGLGSYYQNGDSLWVGWPGYIPKSEEEEKLIAKELLKLNLVPIYLTQEDLEDYYEGFSNEILWPICHYKLSYAKYLNQYWHAYQRVNQKFCDIINTLEIDQSDEIWIHDYQLMLLPQLIRESYEDISIGYFQHIPFPTSEIFKCIPWRDDLLKGLLGADLIAFHTYDDVNHFLTACDNILGLNPKNNSVQCKARKIYVEVFPMGIDFDKYMKLAQSDVVQEKSVQLKTHYQDRKVILCIDRLDYSKGIIERLKAFEKLLHEQPELHSKIVLYMIVVPSRDNVEQYAILKDDIDRMVGNINANYGINEWLPITYFYTSLPIEDLSALYVTADICLVTSLRDGMNLVCKEFVASKAHTNTGKLILSEFAGASKELSDSIVINPNSTDDIMQAIQLALYMPKKEETERMKANVQIVKKFNINHWVKLFFARLHEIKEEQRVNISRKIQGSLENKIIANFNQSKKKMLFLDYDGTLIGFKKKASEAVPTEELKSTLRSLQDIPNNQVIIISGRSHNDLEKWFGHENYYLVAEHGAWTNFPDGEWKHKVDLNTQWKSSVKRIMKKYTDRTAGSLIEEKNYSLAWHYRKVNSGLGSMRAHELAEELRYLLQEYNLQLLMGEKVVEVKLNSLNKGKAALDIVSRNNPDFILAIGDDSTDEDMFFELPPHSHTIKVGNKNSYAKYFIENQSQVLDFLRLFIPKK